MSIGTIAEFIGYPDYASWDTYSMLISVPLMQHLCVIGHL